MKNIFSAVLMLFTFAAVAGDGWMTNFEEAKAKAAKENKSLLVDFTGSDWCGYCIELHKNVFSKAAFTAYAKDKFVLVVLDFPEKIQLSAELKKQNSTLAKKFNVRGYPTVLIMDANGVPYAKTGNRPGGPAEYNKHLDVFLASKAKYDAAMKDAQSASGKAKAAKLVKALSMVSAELYSNYGDIIAEIKKLDPADSSGFVKTQETKSAFNTFNKAIMGFARSKDKASGTKAIAAFLEKYKPEGEVKQQVLFTNVYFLEKPKTKEDITIANALMDKIIAINPTTQVAAQCASIKKQAAQFAKEMK